jgi:homoserine kinase
LSVASVSVKVPGTTANLGAGFDCVGAALTLHNQFTFTIVENAATPVQFEVTGQEADRVQKTADNLVYQSFLKLYQQVQQPAPAVAIDIELGVPLARGLGSSATAIVGGLVGANALAGSPLSQSELLELAIALEGHPDNVVPAFLGGCQLAVAAEPGWTLCELPWHDSIVPIVAIPNFELSTQAARQVLPPHYDRADAVFNVAHFGLLIRGLSEGRSDWLTVALRDRIHQPYRQTLIPGYEAVAQAALGAGACGLVISGAGPTLLTLAPVEKATAIAQQIGQVWSEYEAEVQIQALDRQGVQIQNKIQSQA